MINSMKLSAQVKRGFTLIELLVVIAVIGILATIVLLAVNPAEQLARGRDAARVSGITQLGRSLQGYYTANGGSGYPTANTNWLTTLTNSQDVKLIPTNPTYGSLPNAGATCVVGSRAQGGTAAGYCYNVAAGLTSGAVVYQRLESNLYNSTKCGGGTTSAWWVFSVENAQAGLVCISGNGEPSAAVQTFTP